MLLYILVFFCAYGISPKSSHLIPLGISSCIFCIISILQFANLNPLKLYPGEFLYYAAQDVYTARFIGTLGNEGIASAFMALAIPLFFVYFITAKDRISALALVPMSLLLFVLLYCGVMGGLVGAAGAIVLCTFLHLNSKPRLQRILVCLSIVSLCLALNRLIVPSYTHPKLSVSLKADLIFIAFLVLSLVFLALAAFLYYSNKKINFRTLRIVLALVCVAAVIVGLIFVLNSSTRQGFTFEIREILHGRIDDSFGSSRVRIWRESLKLFAEYPILGSGPNTFPHRSQITFERYSPLKGELIVTYVDNAHNEILNLLVNLGILGLLPFLSAFLSVVLKPRKSLEQKAFASGLWGYFFQSFFLFSICITAPYFWVLLGMSAGKQSK